MSQNFPEPHERFAGHVIVVLDLSNYAIEIDFIEAAGVHTFKLATQLDLASLKAQLDKLHVDKPKTATVELSKLGDVRDNDVVKKLRIIHWLEKLMLLILR